GRTCMIFPFAIVACGRQCARFSALRLRVAAALRALARRSAAGRAADASPPFLPPLWAAGLPVRLPRPEPDLLPPPSSLFTVAQARLSASFAETPFSLYP